MAVRQVVGVFVGELGALCARHTGRTEAAQDRGRGGGLEKRASGKAHWVCFLGRFVFVVRCKPIRTDGRKVICDLAKPRLLQPDLVTAISAFATGVGLKNAKTTPCTVAVKG